LASPRSPNESFNSPFASQQQYFSQSPPPPQPPLAQHPYVHNDFLNSFTNNPNNNARYEPQIVNSPSSGSKNTGSFYTKPPSVVDNINKEFQQKIKENQIILYPPKDYSREDQQRGNFLQAKVTDFRYSLNEHIVGKEAIKQREKKIINALTEEQYENKNDHDNDDGASSDTSFFREEAEKALKILDEAVEGVSLNPIDANRNLFKFKLDEENALNNSYENLDNYNNNSNEAQNRIHKKYSNSTENLFTATASNNNLKNGSFFNSKSTSIASGLNLPNEQSFYDANKDKGFVKKNPLHIIEEENIR
jgi:hypothetical protein